MFHVPDEVDMPTKSIQLVPLSQESRTVLSTAEAALHLNRRPQTLRLWHCAGTAPAGLRPLVVNGRIAWPVDGLRKVLGLDQ